MNQTILVNGEVTGNIGSWPQDGVRFVGYWIGKEHWGKGVATRAARRVSASDDGSLSTRTWPSTTLARSESSRNAASASSARRASRTPAKTSLRWCSFWSKTQLAERGHVAEINPNSADPEMTLRLHVQRPLVARSFIVLPIHR